MSNAGQALSGIVGGVIGFFVGGPTGALYGFQTGLLAGSALFPTELEPVSGPRLEDFERINPNPGAPVAVIYGTVAVSCDPMYLGPVLETSTTEEVGGKGPPEQEITTFQYFQTIAIRLCEGPINGIYRIWENGTLVYDPRPQQPDETDESFNARALMSTEYAETFTLYYGDESQQADPQLELEQGAGFVPAFRGLAYIVYPDRELLPDQATRHPQFKVEISTLAFGDNKTLPTELDYPLFSSFNAFQLAPLWDFDRYVAVSDDSTPKGFRVARISDNTELAHLDSGVLFADVPADTFSGADLLLLAPIISGERGDVYLAYFVNGSDVVHVRWNVLTNEVYGIGALSGSAFIDLWDDGDVFQAAGVEYLVYRSNGSVSFESGADLIFLGTFATGRDECKIAGGSPLGDTGLAYVLAYNVTASGIGPDVLLMVLSYHAGDNLSALTELASIAPAEFSPTWDRVEFVSGILFDPDDDNVVVNLSGGTSAGGDTSSVWAKIEVSTGAVLWSRAATNDELNTDSFQSTRISRGRFAIGTNPPDNGWNIVNSTDGTIEYIEFDEGTSFAQASDMQTGFGISRETGSSPSYFKVYSFTAPITLGDVVTDLSLKSGLAGEDLDVTDLTQIVTGYALTRETTARGAIEPLRMFGQFDIVESDGTLKFPTRGKPIVATLTAEDLGVVETGSAIAPLVSTSMLQDVDLPRQLRLRYSSIERDYQPGEVLSPARFGTIGVNDVTVELPMVLLDQDAAQIAEINFREAWAGRWSHEIALGPDRYALEPGDALEIPVDGRLRRVRAISFSDQALMLRKVNCLRDDDGVYTSTAIAAPPSKPPVILYNLGDTEALYLDLPALRDEDDTPGFYVAGYRTGSGLTWSGARIYRSIDAGATYSGILGLDSQAAVGELVSAPGSGDGYTWDLEGEIVVDMLAGSLESRTELAVLNGANAAAIGADGRWHIVQFVDAELISTNRYRLSKLLLGRRGTEHLIGSESAGDAFVLISGSGIYRAPMQSSEIGSARLYRAVTTGKSFDTASDDTFTGNANALETFSPVYIRGERDGSDNLTITWIRRDRLEQTLPDGVAVPLNEASESYEVDIMNGPTVERTLASSSPTVAYSAANQTSDFGSPQASVTVRVYQLSATVGRGVPGVATI